MKQNIQHLTGINSSPYIANYSIYKIMCRLAVHKETTC